MTNSVLLGGSSILNSTSINSILFNSRVKCVARQAEPKDPEMAEKPLNKGNRTIKDIDDAALAQQQEQEKPVPPVGGVPNPGGETQNNGNGDGQKQDDQQDPKDPGLTPDFKRQDLPKDNMPQVGTQVVQEQVPADIPRGLSRKTLVPGSLSEIIDPVVDLRDVVQGYINELVSRERNVSQTSEQLMEKLDNFEIPLVLDISTRTIRQNCLSGGVVGNISISKIDTQTTFMELHDYEKCLGIFFEYFQTLIMGNILANRDNFRYVSTIMNIFRDNIQVTQYWNIAAGMLALNNVTEFTYQLNDGEIAKGSYTVTFELIMEEILKSNNVVSVAAELSTIAYEVFGLDVQRSQLFFQTLMTVGQAMSEDVVKALQQNRSLINLVNAIRNNCVLSDALSSAPKQFAKALKGFKEISDMWNGITRRSNFIETTVKQIVEKCYDAEYAYPHVLGFSAKMGDQVTYFTCNTLTNEMIAYMLCYNIYPNLKLLTRGSIAESFLKERMVSRRMDYSDYTAIHQNLQMMLNTLLYGRNEWKQLAIYGGIGQGFTAIDIDGEYQMRPTVNGNGNPEPEPEDRIAVAFFMSCDSQIESRINEDSSELNESLHFNDIIEQIVEMDKISSETSNTEILTNYDISKVEIDRSSSSTKDDEKDNELHSGVKETCRKIVNYLNNISSSNRCNTVKQIETRPNDSKVEMRNRIDDNINENRSSNNTKECGSKNLCKGNKKKIIFKNKDPTYKLMESVNRLRE